MFVQNIKHCPKCSAENTPRHREVRKAYIHTWYLCTKCRNPWRTTSDGQGYNSVISAETPHTEDKPRTFAALDLKSPCCGSSGRVRDTWQDERGYFRKHLCRNCGKPFYSCTDGEGNATRFAQRPAKKQFELG